MAVNEHIHIDFEAALAAADPRTRLREAVAVELHEHGADRDDVLTVLDGARLDLREQGREDAADIVADVMDFVVGWCSPAARL